MGALSLGLAAVITGVVTVGWNLIGNLVLPSAWYVPANLLVAAGLIGVARTAGLSWPELGLGGASLGAGLRWGAVAAGVVALGLAVALALPAGRRALEGADVETAAGTTRWFVSLVRIPLGTVVVEEVIFRSVWFGLIARHRGPRLAVTGSALMFGLWHVVPAWETADGSRAAIVVAVAGTVLLTTAAGFVFGELRRRSASLAAPAVAHWATNSLAYSAALVAVELAG